ncbi:MAG: hypothetical protein ACK56I_18025, partial [bacterium]
MLLSVDLDLACLFSEPAVGGLHVQCLPHFEVAGSSGPALESAILGLNGLIHLASGRVYEALVLELHDFSFQISLQLVLLEHVGAGLGLQQRVLFQWCANIVAVVRLESIDSRCAGQHKGQQGHN